MRSGSALEPTGGKQKKFPPRRLSSFGTEKADPAMILEVVAEEIKDRVVWNQIVEIYSRNYRGDVGALPESSGGCVFRVQPLEAFGQDEHTENFTESRTSWRFA